MNYHQADKHQGYTEAAVVARVSFLKKLPFYLFDYTSTLKRRFEIFCQTLYLISNFNLPGPGLLPQLPHVLEAFELLLPPAS